MQPLSALRLLVTTEYLQGHSIQNIDNRSLKAISVTIDYSGHIHSDFILLQNFRNFSML